MVIIADIINQYNNRMRHINGLSRYSVIDFPVRGFDELNLHCFVTLFQRYMLVNRYIILHNRYECIINKPTIIIRKSVRDLHLKWGFHNWQSKVIHFYHRTVYLALKSKFSCKIKVTKVGLDKICVLESLQIRY